VVLCLLFGGLLLSSRTMLRRTLFVVAWFFLGNLVFVGSHLVVSSWLICGYFAVAW